jgi:hypothetical protein
VLQLKSDCKALIAAFLESLQGKDEELQLVGPEGKVLADLRLLSWT